MISKKYIGVYLIFGIPLFVLIFIGGMNYSGFCFAKMKYLTYDEKVLIVFNDTNNKGLGEWRRTTVDGGKSYSVLKIIPYASFEEFTKENPNCCGIKRGTEISPSDFFDLIAGNGYNIDERVTINYKVRYLDKNGNDSSTDLKLDRVVTNCGKVKW